MLKPRRDNARIIDPDHLVIGHAGETYRVLLKRVGAARRYTLRVSAATGEVVLTMPPHGSAQPAREFAERHAAWIGARLKRLPVPVPFTPGAIIPLRGFDHVIAHRPAERGVVWIEEASEPHEPNRLCVAGGEAHMVRRVADFLRREARRDLEAAVNRHIATIGLPERGVTVRDTTSRWGSCSSTGALNFSWRLILAPPFVLDYLAAHEVAHLVHLNHSRRFWTLTRQLAPQTERAEAWLRSHGAGLHRFGVQRDQAN